MSDQVNDPVTMVDAMGGVSFLFEQEPGVTNAVTASGAKESGTADFSFSFGQALPPRIAVEHLPQPFKPVLQNADNMSSDPSSSQQNGAGRPGNWRREHKLSNQAIWKTFSPRRECLTTAGFLSDYNAIITYDNVLLSTMYFASYMWEETLRELGFEPTYAILRRTVNPRGGVFKPVGFFNLYIWYVNLCVFLLLIWFLKTSIHLVPEKDLQQNYTRTTHAR